MDLKDLQKLVESQVKLNFLIDRKGGLKIPIEKLKLIKLSLSFHSPAKSIQVLCNLTYLFNL